MEEQPETQEGNQVEVWSQNQGPGTFKLEGAVNSVKATRQER